MIRAAIFLAALLAVLVCAERSGERDPRIAIWILIAGSLLTLAAGLSGSSFRTASLLFAAIDFLVLAAFYVHALKSRFYWTLCLPAFQLNVCLAHVAKLLSPDIAANAYAAAQGGIWAYPQMIVILIAAIWADSKQRQATEKQ